MMFYAFMIEYNVESSLLVLPYFNWCEFMNFSISVFNIQYFKAIALNCL